MRQSSIEIIQSYSECTHVQIVPELYNTLDSFTVPVLQFLSRYTRTMRIAGIVWLKKVLPQHH
jgi:hypothetical protein